MPVTWRPAVQRCYCRLGEVDMQEALQWGRLFLGGLLPLGGWLQEALFRLLLEVEALFRGTLSMMMLQCWVRWYLCCCLVGGACWEVSAFCRCCCLCLQKCWFCAAAAVTLSWCRSTFWEAFSAARLCLYKCLYLLEEVPLCSLLEPYLTVEVPVPAISLFSVGVWRRCCSLRWRPVTFSSLLILCL